MDNRLSIDVAANLQVDFDMSDVKKKISEIEKLIKQFYGVDVKIPIDLGDAKEKLEQLEKHLNEMLGSGQTLEVDVGDAKERLEILKTTIGGIFGKEIPLEIDASGAQIEIEGLGDSISELGGKEIPIVVDADEAKRELSELDDAFKKSSEVGETAVSALANAVIASGLAKTIKAVTSALWDMINAKIEFEAGTALVKKVTASSTQQMGVLRNEILAMASEIPKSTMEIVSLFEETGRLGIDGRDNIVRFARTMAMLSSTTVMNVTEASRSMAGFAAVVDLPIDQIDRLGSSVSLLGNNVAANENQIMQFAHRLGSAGAAAGLSAAEIVGLSAALAHLQLPASESLPFMANAA